MFELTGQVSIVTGGGSGIGRQVCRTLATAGSKVACLDIDGERAKETVELISKEGGECFATKLDVSKNAEVLSAVKSVISRFGAIHILVNNAGITGVVNPLLNPELAGLENIEEQEWEKVMAINLKGAFLFIKAVIPHMKSKKYGRIVNISSRLGKSGAEFIDGAHYAASKAALINLTKSAAQEYGQYGITVNAVAPSMIKGTGMTSWLTKELEQKLVRKVPLGRLGKTSDVAFAVLFLCSKEAGFITGHTLDVNGGILMD
jgi:3-oxoacyl-[acyl-carrier protein] reductase